MRWYLLFLPFICGFQITEIMYDPEGTDNNREYIEVFTNGSNLSDIIFEDLQSSDTLELLQFFEGDYTLVVEEGFQRTDLNVTIYSVGATIGNSLNNNRDLVLFRTNNSILDAYFYVGERDGGKNNGKSLCRQGDVFVECSPTPGSENDFNQTQENITYTLSISEFLPNPEGDDEAPWPNGEWVELYNYGDRSLSLVGLTLMDAANHSVIISDVHVSPTVLEPQQYAVVSLQKLLLNNEGLETLVLQSPTEVLDILTYSDSREGVSWSKDFKRKRFSLAVPTPGREHHTEEAALNSSLVLERLYVGTDDIVRFGESFRLRLHVYKGDTTKTTIKVYVANLSKQTTVSVEEKFVDHLFTLTIPLPPNCKGTFADGIYTVYAEGLDVTAMIPVTIKGTTKDSCVIVEHNSTRGTIPVQQGVQNPLDSSNSKQPSDNLINDRGRMVYESSDAKARRWAVYFFCFTLLLVIAALLTQDHDQTQSTRDY